MSWIRLNTSFHTHRKTRLLRAKIGDAAYWVMPRLWCYAAENEAEGDFSSYQPDDIAKIVGFSGDPDALIDALRDVGFMDDMKIHQWAEHNGLAIAAYKEKGSRGAHEKWKRFYTEREMSASKTDKDNKDNVDNEASRSPSSASASSPSSASSRKDASAKYRNNGEGNP